MRADILRACSLTMEQWLPLTEPSPQLLQRQEIPRLGSHPPVMHKPLWRHLGGHPPKPAGHQRLNLGNPQLLPLNSYEPFIWDEHLWALSAQYFRARGIHLSASRSFAHSHSKTKNKARNLSLLLLTRLANSGIRPIYKPLQSRADSFLLLDLLFLLCLLGGRLSVLNGQR